MVAPSRVYLAPGMFGFARLAIQDLSTDALWDRIREEAAELSKSEPLIASKVRCDGVIA